MESDSIPQLAIDALERIYRELDEELGRHRPRCELSGRCCDFPAAGHELFATDLEVAFARRAAGSVPEAPPKLCPFWLAGRCELRGGRPLGCRVYFCDPAFAEEMPRIAERFHRRVVAVHEEHGVPYRYRRFISSVREVAG